ncbi:hypothetical protein ACIP9H_34120 [Streptomyces sp. NPDC088732]|uniref:hypothetical protein n=1 Tax=Streptomyces sp. NPDC088732 TaxID=3365879 RepID=UPI00382C0FEC
MSMLPTAHPATADQASQSKYPFAVADVARVAAQLLGAPWTDDPQHWGTVSTLSGPHETDFTFLVDGDDDLVIEFRYNLRYSVNDEFPAEPELPDGVTACDAGVYLETATMGDGLDKLAELSAAAIRAITGAPAPREQS